MSAPLVLSVGTTHPLNVAGVGRDARIAAEYGVAHAMAIAAVSAQNERGVTGIFALEPQALCAQLEAVDLAAPAAVRVGALGTVQNASAAGELLRDVHAPIVFDPVMSASAGGSLYGGDALAAVRGFLDCARTIVTPNLDEAQRLTGIAIGGIDDMIAAGEQLLRRGARAVLVKGGHLAGEPVDVLVAEGIIETFADTRLPQKMRGTGCTLAMALACELALGSDLAAAVRGARAYVRANIARS